MPQKTKRKNHPVDSNGKKLKLSTERRYNIFLTCLAHSPNVSEALKRSGLNRREAYSRRKHDEEFRRQWDECRMISMGTLEDAAFERAMTVSDKLAQFFLTAYFKERFGKVEEDRGGDGVTINMPVLAVSQDANQLYAGLAEHVKANLNLPPDKRHLVESNGHTQQ